jgi:hypothetical protein
VPHRARRGARTAGPAGPGLENWKTGKDEHEHSKTCLNMQQSYLEQVKLGSARTSRAACKGEALRCFAKWPHPKPKGSLSVGPRRIGLGRRFDSTS